MTQPYWGDWYFGWGWFLWFGVWFLLISSFGHWDYGYRINRRYLQQPLNAVLDILEQRYARGEINNDEFVRMKSDIAGR